MSKEQLKYTKSHEWIETAGKERKVGISDFAQSQMGDIVFVDLPAAGKEVKAGDEVVVIESCKATASVYAPVAGKIVAFNKALSDAPEKINQAPYGDGWLFKIEVADEASANPLMDHDAYIKTCNES